MVVYIRDKIKDFSLIFLFINLLVIHNKKERRFMNNYQEVPNIITGKDLDYLSDMFEWNYGAYKKSLYFQEEATMPELVSVFEEASNLFHDNMQLVLEILGGKVNE